VFFRGERFHRLKSILKILSIADHFSPSMTPLRLFNPQGPNQRRNSAWILSFLLLLWVFMIFLLSNICCRFETEVFDPFVRDQDFIINFLDKKNSFEWISNLLVEDVRVCGSFTRYDPTSIGNELSWVDIPCRNPNEDLPKNYQAGFRRSCDFPPMNATLNDRPVPLRSLFSDNPTYTTLPTCLEKYLALKHEGHQDIESSRVILKCKSIGELVIIPLAVFAVVMLLLQVFCVVLQAFLDCYSHRLGYEGVPDDIV
jgi:hypothetical protein